MAKAEEIEDLEEETPEEEPEEVEAPEEEVEAEPEPEPKKPAMVPSFRLHEETEKRRALEAKMRQMEERFQAIQDRLQPKEEEPQIPAYEQDPGGHLKTRQDLIDKKIASFDQMQEQSKASQAEMRQVQAFAGRLSSAEQDFSKEHADYFDAVQFLRDTRMKEYQILGWDPASANAMIDREAIQIGMDAESRGMSAPERFYELAKLRGHKGAQKDPPPKSRSLGPSGRSPKARLTLAEIADLPDDEFDKLTSGESWSKLFR